MGAGVVQPGILPLFPSLFPATCRFCFARPPPGGAALGLRPSMPGRAKGPAGRVGFAHPPPPAAPLGQSMKKAAYRRYFQGSSAIQPFQVYVDILQAIKAQALLAFRRRVRRQGHVQGQQVLLLQVIPGLAYGQDPFLQL